jgi:hypothetical protein
MAAAAVSRDDIGFMVLCGLESFFGQFEFRVMPSPPFSLSMELLITIDSQQRGVVRLKARLVFLHSKFLQRQNFFSTHNPTLELIIQIVKERLSDMTALNATHIPRGYAMK